MKTLNPCEMCGKRNRIKTERFCGICKAAIKENARRAGRLAPEPERARHTERRGRHETNPYAYNGMAEYGTPGDDE